ncbi:MAG: D-alanyl-D-alanine carboxypeptidase [Bacilli bacterium]|nr:D-alanyl-D-alanine carboxypeptidase [Bacilli bacterium]
MKKYLLLFVLFLCFIPNVVFAEELVPNGESSILIEANTGKIIFEKEKDKRVSVASMTKMVAQIIILEEIENNKIKWDDVVTASRNASGMGGSQIYLEEGEKMTVRDLMKGISVASANDATVAMAEYISGTEEKFVKRMNEKVKELGLVNTHFMNCTGLDEDNHYSSAYDMVMIARDLVLNHKEIFNFSSIYEDYLRENTKNKFWLVNTNKLINFYEGADGLKTGHTDDAGYCLATTAKRGDLRLIGVILGEENSKVRNNEMIDLLDYGFNNIKSEVLKKKDEAMTYKNISHGDKKVLNIGLKNDIIVYSDIEDENKYDFKYKYNDIYLPIKKGDLVGKVNVYYNDILINSTDLIALDNINKVSFYQLCKESIFDLLFGNL